jgi:phytoene dehydrogenase-like protein
MIRRRTGADASFDVIIVGGGHNGLVCAGYLVREGLSVAVVENKKIVGGCVVTEEVSPGWRINTYGLEHYVIQNTPIVSDLSLPRYGLEYYSLEPTVFSPFKNQKHMLFHRKLEKTVSHISGLSQKDARSYEKFHAKWSRVQRAIGMAALSGPVSLEESLCRSPEISRIEVGDIVQDAMLPASTLLAENFETDYVASPIAFLGPAAVGQSPAAEGTGWLLAWHIGAEKVARPKGGSGALTVALARMIEANRGTIVTGERVSRITVAEGRVTGVEMAGGRTLSSRFVSSGADPKQTLLELLEDTGALGTSEKRKVRGIKVSAGFTFKADYLLGGLPRYASTRSIRAAGAATFIAESVASRNQWRRWKRRTRSSLRD